MKRLLIVFMTCWASGISSGQVEVSVWTDKSTYAYGETISIIVTAFNPTSDTIVLNFGSSCQAGFRIDDFILANNVACAQVLTSKVVLPFQTGQWGDLEYPFFHTSWPLLPVGAHSVVGEVYGYGHSDTLQIFVTPVTSVTGDDPSLSNFRLECNYPNPFNTTTIIPYSVSTPGRIVIGIFNAIGQAVRTLKDEYSQAGSYTISVDLHDQPSGVYWCRLESNGRIQTTRLILAR